MSLISLILLGPFCLIILIPAFLPWNLQVSSKLVFDTESDRSRGLAGSYTWNGIFLRKISAKVPKAPCQDKVQREAWHFYSGLKWLLSLVGREVMDVGIALGKGGH